MDFVVADVVVFVVVVVLAVVVVAEDLMRNGQAQAAFQHDAYDMHLLLQRCGSQLEQPNQ